MNALLDRTEADIAMRIRDKLRNSKGLNTPVEVRRMQALIETVKAIRSSGWNEASSFLFDEMQKLSYQEPIFVAGLMALNAPVIIETVMPPARQLREIALARPFEGRLLSDWAATMEVEDLRRIQSSIQLGMVAGEGSETIANRVFGTMRLKGTDGATEMTRRQVQAITRTAVQYVANSTRDKFFQDNDDIIEAEVFVATLDARTTPICRALDGKHFEVGKGPRPPLHFACRSLRIAYFGEDQLGQRPAKSSTRRMLLDEFTEEEDLDSVDSRDDLPHGTKGQFDAFERTRVRELTGTVPASTSYNEWLRTQSNAFQDEIMGVTKAKLYRDGGLSLDKYVAANGTELTLAQLAAKYRDAFLAAGLDPLDF